MLAKGIDVKPPGADCEHCALSNCIFVDSIGPEDADIVIVGEAPGYEEMKSGRPFVGRSGKLLTKALSSCGISRDSIYITNAVCCRPDNNDTPKQKEIQACRGRLIHELSKYPHKAIILLGNIALKAVIGSSGIKKYVGSAIWDDRFKCFIYPNYHPAAVLRTPSLYNDFYNFLKAAIECRVKKTPELKQRTLINADNIDQCISEMKATLNDDKILTIDIETASNGDILVIGMASRTGYVYQILGITIRDNVQVFEKLRNFFSMCRINAHNTKFDYEQLRIKRLQFGGIGFDTMLAMYVLDERAGKHGLEVLAKNEFNAPIYYEEADKFKTHMEDMPLEDMLLYNALDVNYCHAGMEVLKSRLDDNDRRVLYNILIPATYPLAMMETTGVLIDVERLHQVGVELEEKAKVVEAQMYDFVGEEFNPNSPKQVLQVMHNKLGIPVVGKLNADKDKLKELSQYSEFPNMLLEYRQLVKLKSTYVDGILEHLDENNRLHGKFNLHVTATGRLSSSEPNLQNIPKHIGPLIRDMFIASPGYKLMEFDLQQAELRVVAWLAQDKKFIELIESGVDVHTATTMLITGLPADKIDKELRQKGKQMNFAIVYQQSPQSTAEVLKVSLSEAIELHRKLAENMPDVIRWIEETKQQIIKTGMVITPLGRKRRFGIINDDALREGVNMPVQSVASDIMLLTIANLHNIIDWDTIRMLITVHDSLLVEVREDKVDYWAKIILNTIEKTAVENVGMKNVKIGADATIGDRWSQMKDYKVE